MSLAQIRDEYRVSARLGPRVSVKAPAGFVHGTITGSSDEWVIVQLDDGRGDAAFYPTHLTFHPTTKEN